jgi:hypothetical protein
MEEIKLAPTQKTPSVTFNNSGMLELKGRSIPENSLEFYKPLIDWVESYNRAPAAETNVHVQLEYFNTSSSKCLLDFFKRLESIGNKVFIHWYYEQDESVATKYSFNPPWYQSETTGYSARDSKPRADPIQPFAEKNEIPHYAASRLVFEPQMVKIPAGKFLMGSTKEQAAQYMYDLHNALDEYDTRIIFHLNDSAGNFGTGKDIHDHITEGKIWAAYSEKAAASIGVTHAELFSRSGAAFILNYVRETGTAAILERDDAGPDLGLITRLALNGAFV